MTRTDGSSRKAAFIAGDWGTSSLRLALCDTSGQALEARKGPGAADSRGKFAAVFDDLSADWRRAHGELPAVLCGMVGSAFGWREAPYLPCPEELDSLVDSMVEARDRVHIVPGMRCTNPLGAPDLMRGEETQLLGARRLQPGLGEGRRLVCLPGTHTKWVSLHNGVVQEFLTVPTGELFALLCNHSVIVRDPATPLDHRPAEFERGLAESARHPEVPLIHRLFKARSLRLDKQLSAEGAASWVSGLLIGTDVAGALPLFANVGPDAPVHLVGASELMERYATVLSRRGRAVVRIDGDAASQAGLARIFQDLEAPAA